MSRVRARSRNRLSDSPSPGWPRSPGRATTRSCGRRRELVARGRLRDAVPRVGLVLRSDQAPDPRVGGGEQFPQQVGAEEPGRAGEQDLARVAPVRPRPGRGAVAADADVKRGLGDEVDLLLIAVGAQPARAGVLHRGREAAQGGVAQQAAGQRPDRVGRDAEAGAGARQHLRREQGVAAEGEEVVVEADALAVQQPRPEGGQSRLGRGQPLALLRHSLAVRARGRPVRAGWAWARTGGPPWTGPSPAGAAWWSATRWSSS